MPYEDFAAEPRHFSDLLKHLDNTECTYYREKMQIIIGSKKDSDEESAMT